MGYMSLPSGPVISGHFFASVFVTLLSPDNDQESTGFLFMPLMVNTQESLYWILAVSMLFRWKCCLRTTSNMRLSLRVCLCVMAESATFYDLITTIITLGGREWTVYRSPGSLDWARCFCATAISLPHADIFRGGSGRGSLGMRWCVCVRWKAVLPLSPMSS